MTCGVYQFLNIVNGWKYVGSSVSVEKRCASHLEELRAGKHINRHLQNAWTKYGAEAFEWSILEECKPDELLEREQSYLPPERTVAALKTNGFYNHCPVAGSWLGVKHSEETKQKMKGRKFSEATREKLSKAKKGIRLERKPLFDLIEMGCYD